jgi:hypothetical protein
MEVRYLDIHEDDQLDEAQVATWIREAAALPGWVPLAPAGILASSPSLHRAGEMIILRRHLPYNLTL